MKISKYLSVSLTTHLTYDDDIKVAVGRSGNGFDDGFGPRIQFKEVFDLGLSISLISKRSQKKVS